MKEKGNEKMAQKKYNVRLTDEEVAKLKSMIRKKETNRTLKCRCQILLDLDEVHGKMLNIEQTAKSNGVCKATVSNTVKKYAQEGLESVINLKRSVNSDNARRKLDGRAEARLIEIACSPAPEGHSRWTLRLLEQEAKVVLETPVGKNAIGRALKKTKLSLTKTHTGASRKKKTRIL